MILTNVDSLYTSRNICSVENTNIQEQQERPQRRLCSESLGIQNIYNLQKKITEGNTQLFFSPFMKGFSTPSSLSICSHQPYSCHHLMMTLRFHFLAGTSSHPIPPVAVASAPASSVAPYQFDHGSCSAEAAGSGTSFESAQKDQPSRHHLQVQYSRR
jgi:hypothetical protein